MHALRRLACVAGIMSVGAIPAAAQTCLGLPETRANLSANVAFPEDGHTIGARMGINSRNIIGGVSVGTLGGDSFGSSSTTLGVDIGASLPQSKSHSIHLCPIASYTYVSGPNLDIVLLTLKSRGIRLMAGFTAGGIMAVKPGVSVIPNASLGVLHERSTITMGGIDAVNPLGEPADGEPDFHESTTGTGAMLEMGAAFVFNDNLTLHPRVSIPIGFQGASPVISVGAAVGFGRKQVR